MQLVAESSCTVLRKVTATVAAALRMDEGRLDADEPLESFGVDSIIVMELMSKLSKQFSMSITPAQFMQFKTLRELANFIEMSSVPDGPADAVSEPAQRMTQTPRPHSSQALPDAARWHESTGTNQPNETLLAFVRSRYGIELEPKRYESVDALVDVLVEHHADSLLTRVGRPVSPAEPATGELSAGPKSPGISFRGSRRDVAIVGLSCRFPDAPDPEVFLRNLDERISSIREIPRSRWNWESFYSDTIRAGRTVSRWGALLEDVDKFDAAFFKISAGEARLMDPQERLLCEEVYKALEDAGIDVSGLSGTSTGVFVGYEYAEYEQQLRLHRDAIENAPSYSSSSPAYYLANRLSYLFDLRGPSEAINVNCASSAVAVNRACQSLLSGESTLAVAAGVSLNLFPDDYLAATQYHLLSPNGTCAVFDDNANGYTRGEGVGVVILKSREDAERDGNRIYAIIKACHQNNRGRAPSLSDIKPESITQVITDCYRKAGIEAEDVSYIEIDGYCTKWGDSCEFEGIKQAFSGAARCAQKLCALGSVKPNIGHLEPASGMASLIKVALSLHRKRFPPTLAATTMNEFIDLQSAAHPLCLADGELLFDALRREPDRPVRAGINSFADSGANVHILLEEYQPQRRSARAEAAQREELFVLSAQDSVRLEEYLQRIAHRLSARGADISFSDLVFTVQTGRQAMEVRIGIQAASTSELLRKIELFMAAEPARRTSLQNSGIYYGDLQSDAKNLLCELMSADMIHRMLGEAVHNERWREIALLWTNGVHIPWRRAWERRTAEVVSLPSYPFGRDRHWLDAIGNSAAPEQSAPSVTQIELNAPAGIEDAREGDDGEEEPPQWIFAAESGGAADAGGLSRFEKVQLFLRQQLAMQLHRPTPQIATNQTYLELGLNSLGVVGLCRRINQLLDIRLSPSVLMQHYDIDRLSAHLAAEYGSQIDAISVRPRTVAMDWNEISDYPSGADSTTFAAEHVLTQSQGRILAEILWTEDHANDGSYEKLAF